MSRSTSSPEGLLPLSMVALVLPMRDLPLNGRRRRDFSGLFLFRQGLVNDGTRYAQPRSDDDKPESTR
ncbi:uncharacterized protein METZ01_LOCUS479444, partial [marine metagenome]